MWVRVGVVGRGARAAAPVLLAGALCAPGGAVAHDAPLCAEGAAARAPLVCASTLPPFAAERCAPVAAPVCPPGGGAAADPPSRAEGRAALGRARQLAAEGRIDAALEALALVERAFPHLADRLAHVRGTALLAAGSMDRACDAFFEAADRTEDPGVRARARIAYTECRLRADHPDAAADRRLLAARYPALSQARRLDLLAAERRERAGDVRGAIAAYRALDLAHPGSPEAGAARARLAVLASEGHAVREAPLTWRVARAERLVADGPMDLARREVEALLALDALRPDLARRLVVAAARLAFLEGRYEAAAALGEQAAALPAAGEPGAAGETAEGAGVGPTGDDGEAAAGGAAAEDPFAETLERYRALAAARHAGEAARLARLRGEGPARRLPTPRLFAVVELAARLGDRARLDEALEALAARERVPPSVRFEAAVRSAGLGDDLHLARLLEPVLDHRTYGLAARYHRARALERLGRLDVATLAFDEVVRRDEGSATGFYALWAKQRMREVARAKRCRCTPRPEAPAAGAPMEAAPELALALDGAPLGLGLAAPALGAAADAPPDTTRWEAALDVLDAAHGEAFPWFARARDLLYLGEVEAARDELHEAYLAWRQAAGRALSLVGVEAVLRDGPRGRVRGTAKQHAARRVFPKAARLALAEVASGLGDEGVAVGLVGPERAARHPRPYEDVVTRAAARHGLDPSLLYAIMRVESVYQERIVSYAGAVGLMQIMPRTGALVADQLGLDDFATTDLLDPEVNVELAAWYLASLLVRFDGRVPLAVAAYNGGPHNVRAWMEEAGDGLAVEAFLERIPFEQTHRYVRRVMHHWAAYRAQEGLDLPPLHPALPARRPDPLAF